MNSLNDLQLNTESPWGSFEEKILIGKESNKK